LEKYKHCFYERKIKIPVNISVILWRSVLVVEGTGVPGENS
jgi:hypothetical protein